LHTFIENSVKNEIFSEQTLIENVTLKTDKFFTVKSNFEKTINEKSIRIDLNDAESTMGTMIINDTIIINQTIQKNDSEESVNDNLEDKEEEISEKELKRVKNIILKEANDFKLNKTSDTKALSKQDIELRIQVLEIEMAIQIEQLKLKYSKNKENILKALEIKRKNHQIY
jgi:hypothetical protein